MVTKLRFPRSVNVSLKVLNLVCDYGVTDQDQTLYGWTVTFGFGLFRRKVRIIGAAIGRPNARKEAHEAIEEYLSSSGYDARSIGHLTLIPEEGETA